MADDKPQKVSIGFTGTQVLSGRIPAAELAKLRDALGTEGWRDVRFEDGTVALDLSRVVYVLVEDEEHRVAFTRDVQDRAALSGIEVLEQPAAVGVGFVAGERAPLAQRITFWCFNFGDLGAEVGEQFAAVRT